MMNVRKIKLILVLTGLLLGVFSQDGLRARDFLQDKSTSQTSITSFELSQAYPSTLKMLFKLPIILNPTSEPFLLLLFVFLQRMNYNLSLN